MRRALHTARTPPVPCALALASWKQMQPVVSVLPLRSGKNVASDYLSSLSSSFFLDTRGSCLYAASTKSRSLRPSSFFPFSRSLELFLVGGKAGTQQACGDVQHMDAQTHVLVRWVKSSIRRHRNVLTPEARDLSCRNKPMGLV